MGADLTVVNFSVYQPTVNSEPTNHRISKEQITEALNLADAEIERLFGDADSMALYNLTISNANGEPEYFSLSANIKEAYGTAEELDWIVESLQRKIQDSGHGLVDPSQVAESFLEWFKELV